MALPELGGGLPESVRVPCRTSLSSSEAQAPTKGRDSHSFQNYMRYLCEVPTKYLAHSRHLINTYWFTNFHSVASMTRGLEQGSCKPLPSEFTQLWELEQGKPSLGGLGPRC